MTITQLHVQHRHRLLAWLISVVVVTFVHHVPTLLVGSALVLLVSGSGRTRLAWQALRTVGPVLLLISSGWLVMGALSGDMHAQALLLINARVALLALLTTWMVRDVNLAQALSAWPAAQRWLIIVRGQIRLFRRLASDHRLARRSRSSVRPTLRQRYLGAAAVSLAALDKAVHNAETVTQAMRSRGALHD